MSLEAGAPVDWTLEAPKLAREIAVSGVGANDHLGESYLEAARPTRDRQFGVVKLPLKSVWLMTDNRRLCRPLRRVVLRQHRTYASGFPTQKVRTTKPKSTRPGLTENATPYSAKRQPIWNTGLRPSRSAATAC